MTKRVTRGVAAAVVVLGAAAILVGVYWPRGPRGPVTREQRAHDALSRVTDIELDLAKVRELAFQRMVPAAYQSGSDFRAFVHRHVDKEQEKSADLQTALVALGLLPPGIDLARAVEDSFATQAAAYYSPEVKKFFLVMVPESELALDFISAHELTHGLQDQHFDLERYMSGGTADALAARRFVVEGDAMFAAMLYLIYQKTHVAKLTLQQLEPMRTQLEKLASLDTSAMVALLKQQSATSAAKDPEIKKSIEAMDSIPLTVLAPAVESYLGGALLVVDAYEKGGWPAVDQLYTHPPESTEQVLHPKQRLLDKRDLPRQVTLPALAGYERVGSDVLGELQWSVYFRLWKHEGDGHEEQNWGGDRYAVWRKDGKLTALVATTWDTEYDATVFYHSYVSTLATRFPDVHVQESHDDIVSLDSRIWVRRVGSNVFIVDGGDRKLLDMVVAKTTFE